MKYFSRPRISEILMVCFSIMLLVFLCVFPSMHTSDAMNKIIAQANECLHLINSSAASNGYIDNAANDQIKTHIDTAYDAYRSISEHLQMFYSHNEINALETAIKQTEYMLANGKYSFDRITECIGQIIESAEHLKSHEILSWGAFL